MCVCVCACEGVCVCVGSEAPLPLPPLLSLLLQGGDRQIMAATPFLYDKVHPSFLVQVMRE